MKEIVQQILETEREIREKIDQAHAEAQKIVRNAEIRSREILDERRQEATREGQQMIERLKQEAEEERNRQVEAVKGGSPELLSSRSREIEQVVTKITGLVTGQEGL
ncbi:MAG: hypothetical protein JXB45_08920 [Candidatus Krumholzibacteriota bacterium]|nr:hypothetical protein [Candidatus Krumholzibacteriota bacterium]